MLINILEKKLFYNSLGKKIRRIRRRKGLSSKELAEQCQITGAAVRNYENSVREPSEETLQRIAASLCVNVSTLTDRKMSSLSDVMHTLFEMEEDNCIIPMLLPENEKGCARYDLVIINEFLNEALEQWYVQRKKWENNEITDSEYQEWKERFPSS